MTKTGKTILTIVAVVVPLGIIISAVMWGKGIWDKIKIKPFFVSVDFKGLSLKDAQDILINGGEKTINAVIGMEVKNNSGTNISFSGLRAKLYYNGVVLAETSQALANKKLVATAHNESDPLKVTDSVTIKLNKSTAQFALDKLLGRKPQIDYTIELSLFGIPILKWFPIKGNFKL